MPPRHAPCSRTFALCAPRPLLVCGAPRARAFCDCALLILCRHSDLLRGDKARGRRRPSLRARSKGTQAGASRAHGPLERLAPGLFTEAQRLVASSAWVITRVLSVVRSFVPLLYTLPGENSEMTCGLALVLLRRIPD